MQVHVLHGGTADQRIAWQLGAQGATVLASAGLDGSKVGTAWIIDQPDPSGACWAGMATAASVSSWPAAPGLFTLWSCTPG